MKRAVIAWLFSVLLIIVDTDAVSGQCLRDQQLLLLKLHDSLKIDASESTKLVSWNMSEDCCNWAGVSCDEVGHVTGLDLSYESISGGIEKSGLFNLSYLRMLNLSGNNFNATLPTGLANLTELIHLNLSNAGFVNQIPIEISKMTSLVTLDLSYSDPFSLSFQNSNLTTLVQNFRQLRELHLDGVYISDGSNEWCQALSSSLPNLQVLSLSNCYLAGPIHPSLAKLQSLSVIRLDGNHLNTPFPDFFVNFSKLTVLWLNSCQLNGTVPEKLFQMPTLEILDLSKNELLQGSLPELGENMSLRSMVLSNTQLSGALPQSLGSLRNLSRIELAGCNFSGPIPSSIAMLTQLVHLDFSFNAFNGSFPSLQKSKELNYVDCSHNGFTGEIPRSIFDIKGLSALLLSSNKLNGTIKLDQIWKLGNLTAIDLSYNNLTVDAKSSNSTTSSSPQLKTIRLASCNFRAFPDLRIQSKIEELDLSDNQINGSVPRWIWEVGNGSLIFLNLSKNLLTNLDQPYSFASLYVLDLHLNQLHGKIPPPPPSARHIDYSSNRFNSEIPQEVDLSSAIFFSASNNSLTGAVPKSICNATALQVLDLSNNKLNGTIPRCINATSLRVLNLSNNKLNGTIPRYIFQMGDTVDVLNLRRNSLTGSIPDELRGYCALRTLDLSWNQLEGKVPKFLDNCPTLEVLDLGNNQINDVFPCFLKRISSLRVLVLRKNRFFGNVGCPNMNTSWTKLQIVDLAFNNFGGILPYKFLTTSEAMKGNVNETYDLLNFELFLVNQLYYQDSVTVTSKGLQMELVKILTVFTSVDFSSNYFEGPIPEVIGQFEGLHILNLSHNALNGSIPSTLGNLSQLESLDLSVNNLIGAIPQQLAGLTFLSFLNLSYNKLVGMIPTSTQLQSFLPTSFEGNAGLCGPPLAESCRDDEHEDAHLSSETDSVKVPILSVEIGYIFGLVVIIGPLVYCKRCRLWYYRKVDYYLFRIFPRLEESNRKTRGQRGQRVRGRRN